MASARRIWSACAAGRGGGSPALGRPGAASVALAGFFLDVGGSFRVVPLAGRGLPTLLILDTSVAPPSARPSRLVQGGRLGLRWRKTPFIIVSGGTAWFNSRPNEFQSAMSRPRCSRKPVAGAAVLFAAKFPVRVQLEPEYRFPSGGPGPYLAGWPGPTWRPSWARGAALWHFRKMSGRPVAGGAILLVLIRPFLLARPGVVLWPTTAILAGLRGWRLRRRRTGVWRSGPGGRRVIEIFAGSSCPGTGGSWRA